MADEIIVEYKGKKYLVKTDRRYTETDEWAKPEENGVRVGITDYAQKELHDIVGVDLPEPGTCVKKGEEIAVVESVKATSDVYSPVSGEVVEVNERLYEEPELLNKDPYGEGWLVVLKPDDPSELDELLSPEDYVERIKQGKAGH